MPFVTSRIAMPRFPELFDYFLRFLTFALGITLLILGLLPPLIASHGNHGKSHDNVPCNVNLLKNPSFETNSMRGHDVSPWTTSGQLSSWRASTDHASHGSNSLKVWTKDACWVGQHFDHEEGGYTGGFSALWTPGKKNKRTKDKASSPSLEKKEKCKIVVRNSGKVVFEKPKDMQPGKWRRYSFRFSSSEMQQIRTGRGNFELGLVCGGRTRSVSAGGDDEGEEDVYYFDEIDVRKECRKGGHHDEL